MATRAEELQRLLEQGSCLGCVAVPVEDLRERAEGVAVHDQEIGLAGPLDRVLRQQLGLLASADRS